MNEDLQSALAKLLTALTGLVEAATAIVKQELESGSQ